MTWEPARFSDLFRIKHGYAFDGRYFDGEGPYVLLTPGNFREEGGYQDQGPKQKFYTGDVPSGFVLDQDDLLVAMTEQAPGLLGSSAWIPEANVFLHNQRLGRVVDLNECRLSKRFLYYLFNTQTVRDQISASATGTKVRHTAPQRIGQVLVNLPSVREQERIAEILATYDDLIQNNHRRMALLEEAARQLYVEWFVRLRFPGHEHTCISNGVPNGWNRLRLDEIADINGTMLKATFDTEIEYVDIASVTSGTINETTTYDSQSAPSRARRVVRHGDIIWSCVRPNRRSYAVIWQPAPNLIVSTGFAVITPKTVPTSFLYQATTTDAFVGYLENRARGAAYPAVLARDFERAEIRVPGKPLLDAFNEQVEFILWQSHNLHLQNIRLRAARDLLLPRLMNGEITV